MRFFEKYYLKRLILDKGIILNRNWNKLKKSSNGIPTWDSLIPYILEVLKDGEEATKKVIKQRLFDFLQVPEEVLNQRYPSHSSGKMILPNRIGFALSDLCKAGALQRPKRGIYQITDIGLSLLKTYGDRLTTKILEEQPEYIQYEKELEIRNQKTDRRSDLGRNEGEIQGDIRHLVTTKNNEVAIELLDKVRNSDPYFFERMVVKLLENMGYSGDYGEARVTQKSNDGGIDGIINQDPLGTSTVYIQVKRNKEDNTVGRSTIQSFYGALADINADRGVFITTSSYAKGAEEFAKNQGIVLIDGIQLTDLMLRYEVGVEKAEEYVVYQIDNDYFEMEE